MIFFRKRGDFMSIDKYIKSKEKFNKMPFSTVYAVIVELVGDSEFLKAVDGRKADKVWKLIDELVEAVKILHPRMYTTFIDKVQDL